MLPVAKKAASGHDYYDYESTGMVVPRYESSTRGLTLRESLPTEFHFGAEAREEKIFFAIETGYLRIFALL